MLYYCYNFVILIKHYEILKCYKTYSVLSFKNITTSNKYPAVTEFCGLILDDNILDVCSICSITEFKLSL